MTGPVIGSTSSLSATLHTLDSTDMLGSGKPENGADGSRPDQGVSDDATAPASIQSDLMHAVEDQNALLASSIVRRCKSDEEKADVLVHVLFHACKDGSLRRVETCLGLGADPNRAGTDGLSALASAVERDNAGLVEYLLQNAVWRGDVHVYTVDGRSLLELVKSDSVAGILIEHGASFNDRDRNGQTGLMKTSSETVARRFLAGGCDVNATDDQSMTALLYSLKSRKSVGMFKLLVDAGADCTPIDKVKKSAWHYFAGREKGHYSNEVPWTAADLQLISEQLHKAGADAKTIDKLGFTPLYCAANTGNLDVLTALLRNGGFRKEELNVVNEGGRTALHRAVDLDHPEVAKFLLDHGADPNVETTQGTPLHRAVQSKTPDMAMIKLLLGHGADLSIKDCFGSNALHRVCANGNASSKMVKAVFSKTPDVNATDWAGATALHLVAKHGSVDSLGLLLDSGLVVRTLEDNNGNLPIFYAATRSENASDLLECFAPYRLTRAKPAAEPSYPFSRVSIFVRKGERPGFPDDLFTVFRSEIFAYYRHSTLPAPKEGFQSQWIHLPAAGPDALYDMVTTHFFARNSHIPLTAQEWEEFHLFLKMPKSPALLQRPRVLCRQDDTIETRDVGDVAPEDEVKMVIVAVPCFNSSIDGESFATKSEESGTRTTELRSDLLTCGHLWLCLIGEKYFISTFPHEAQQKDSVIELVFDKRKVPQVVRSTQQLAVWLTSVYCKNELALNELMRYVYFAESREEAMSANFERAVAGLSSHSMDGSTRDVTAELFDITAESGLALDLQRASKNLKAARGVVILQLAFIDAMVELATKRSQGDLRRQAGASSRVLRDQVQKLDDLQASVTETNEALLVLLDLKQRQGNSIEARSAREQSVLARYQNQTLLVFTIVTVIFLPLSFIAGLLAIDIIELPHNADGNQQLPLDFVLRYVLGPGLGCASLCILIAFAGTIKRASIGTNRWLTSSTGKQRMHDPETGDAREKLKAS